MKGTKQIIEDYDANHKKAVENFEAIETVTEAGRKNMSATFTQHIEACKDDKPAVKLHYDVQLVKSLIHQQQKRKNSVDEQTMQSGTSNRHSTKICNEASVSTLKTTISAATCDSQPVHGSLTLAQSVQDKLSQQQRATPRQNNCLKKMVSAQKCTK